MSECRLSRGSFKSLSSTCPNIFNNNILSLRHHGPRRVPKECNVFIANVPPPPPAEIYAHTLQDHIAQHTRRGRQRRASATGLSAPRNASTRRCRDAAGRNTTRESRAVRRCLRRNGSRTFEKGATQAQTSELQCEARSSRAAQKRFGGGVEVVVLYTANESRLGV